MQDILHRQQQRRASAARVSEAIADHCILQEMKTCLRQHLAAAALECSALSRDLSLLDPDAVMASVYAEFGADGKVSDCFSDAFYTSECAMADAGGEPVAYRSETQAKA